MKPRYTILRVDPTVLLRPRSNRYPFSSLLASRDLEYQLLGPLPCEPPSSRDPWISATCPPQMDGSDPFFPYSRGLTLVYLPKYLMTVGIPSSDLTIQIGPDAAPFSTALWTWKNQQSRCSHGAWGSTIQISSLFTKIEERGFMALNALIYSLD